MVSKRAYHSGKWSLWIKSGLQLFGKKKHSFSENNIYWWIFFIFFFKFISIFHLTSSWSLQMWNCNKQMYSTELTNCAYKLWLKAYRLSTMKINSHNDWLTIWPCRNKPPGLVSSLLLPAWWASSSHCPSEDLKQCWDDCSVWITNLARDHWWSKGKALPPAFHTLQTSSIKLSLSNKP